MSMKNELFPYPPPPPGLAPRCFRCSHGVCVDEKPRGWARGRLVGIHVLVPDCHRPPPAVGGSGASEAAGFRTSQMFSQSVQPPLW